MDRRKTYDIAYLADRTLRFVLAWGVSRGTTREALEWAVWLLHDTKADICARHRHEGARELCSPNSANLTLKILSWSLK
ncbi:hypothetical protein [Bordetella sp. FB-8]|uniref:hypothetical protein n=1 Tax=Bordetella sp. FB-8 TaxID=1159870 RepID=UPI0012DBE41D|nr:hypothetical protein [Bordetella sp. FB-8]